MTKPFQVQLVTIAVAVEKGVENLAAQIAQRAYTIEGVRNACVVESPLERLQMKVETPLEREQNVARIRQTVLGTPQA